VFNRPYLAPFGTVEGIGVAICISWSFGFAIWWLQRIAQIRTPARFLSGRNVLVAS
jgi:tight adherence protein B